ncbi:hypothetical protein AAEP93_006943 [Penicillium crustosum]
METARDSCGCLLIIRFEHADNDLPPAAALNQYPHLNASTTYSLNIPNSQHEPQIHEKLPAYQEATHEFIGSPLEDVVTKNSANGQQWRDTIEGVCNSIKKADRKIVFANIVGAKAHLSSTDKDDMQEVISVTLLTKAGISVGALHLHFDSTWKLFPRGRGVKAGHAPKIKRASLPGCISTNGTP